MEKITKKQVREVITLEKFKNRSGPKTYLLKEKESYIVSASVKFIRDRFVKKIYSPPSLTDYPRIPRHVLPLTKYFQWPSLTKLTNYNTT